MTAGSTSRSITAPRRGDPRWSGAATGWRRAVITTGWTLAFPFVGGMAVIALIAVVIGAAADRLVRADRRRTRPGPGWAKA